MAKFKVGTEVGAERWPRQGSHPDCWGRPWAGKVLALDDVRAWAGTIGYVDRAPDPADVKKRVASLLASGYLQSTVPVLWEFGKVHWERTAALRPYADDFMAWVQARKVAMSARTQCAEPYAKTA